MNKRLKIFRHWAIAAVLTAVSAPAWAEWELNLRQGVSDISQRAYDMHMLALWICVGVGAVVFGAMFYSIYAHRKSRGQVPAQFSHSTKAEVIWTIIPILILIMMAIPATRALIFMRQTGDADMTVKVTGYQWKWKYDYLEDDVSILSSLHPDHDRVRRLGSGLDPASTDAPYLLDVDNPIVLPTNTKIRFLITSDDVIHSWWVPDFGWKRDAVPGFVNESWVEIKQPGTYRGQCAELCGKDHGFMPIVVEAKPPGEYMAWVQSQKDEARVAAAEAEREWSFEELLSHGEAVYQQQCASCHQPDGQGLAPGFPALAGNPVATGPLGEHVSVVVNGRPGTAMQAFGQMLDASDIAAAVTYTRNAWGNDTKDVVQPRDIKAAKGSES